MTKSLLKSGLGALALGLALGLPGGVAAAQTGGGQAAETPAQPGPAVKRIRAFYDALLHSMKNAKTLGVKGRYKTLEPAVDAAFDFETMTKLTVGPDWQSMPAAGRKALVAAFRRMTIADYAHNFDGYEGEDFTVDPNVRDHGGDEIVSSKMTMPGKDAIPFVYRMRKTADGDWKIIDIYLNGYVSEVATRRADFASTLKSGGASALAQKLNTISDNELSGK